MENKKPEPTHREITYQVGWKRGKIELKDTVHPQALTHTAEASSIFSKVSVFYRRFVWREAPMLPESFLYILLWALPLISFLLTVVVVYNLSHP